MKSESIISSDLSDFELTSLGMPPPRAFRRNEVSLSPNCHGDFFSGEERRKVADVIACLNIVAAP